MTQETQGGQHVTREAELGVTQPRATHWRLDEVRKESLASGRITDLLTFISDPWSPDLSEHTIRLFGAPQLVVLCDGSLKNLTQFREECLLLCLYHFSPIFYQLFTQADNLRGDQHFSFLSPILRLWLNRQDLERETPGKPSCPLCACPLLPGQAVLLPKEQARTSPTSPHSGTLSQQLNAHPTHQAAWVWLSAPFP